jgi:hypothetical protein
LGDVVGREEDERGQEQGEEVKCCSHCGGQIIAACVVVYTRGDAETRLVSRHRRERCSSSSGFVGDHVMAITGSEARKSAFATSFISAAHPCVSGPARRWVVRSAKRPRFEVLIGLHVLGYHELRAANQRAGFVVDGERQGGRWVVCPPTLPRVLARMTGLYNVLRPTCVGECMSVKVVIRLLVSGATRHIAKATRTQCWRDYRKAAQSGKALLSRML